MGDLRLQQLGRGKSVGRRVVRPVAGQSVARAAVRQADRGTRTPEQPLQQSRSGGAANSGLDGHRVDDREFDRFADALTQGRGEEAALDLVAATAGAFDPTVGPLVARYGFGPIHQGSAGLGPSLAAGDGHLTKAEDGVTLDLCGIAKGHALDRVADVLADAGQRNFLIDVGGELLARGRHPSGRPWQAAVEDPRTDATGAAAILALDNMAIATSGTRWNSYVLGGRTISHMIDPTSGEPVRGTLASVSVLATTAMEADGSNGSIV